MAKTKVKITKATGGTTRHVVKVWSEPPREPGAYRVLSPAEVRRAMARPSAADGIPKAVGH
jgi:hypothetical protein